MTEFRGLKFKLLKYRKTNKFDQNMKLVSPEKINRGFYFRNNEIGAKKILKLCSSA